ncbi:MAG TPA: NFACT RNA binding domain-containing protein, partial [Planctomycetota bacterium]|nr:NFACT RNA binding domain-containing protein [Planctomycetota bacterium]
MGAAGADHGRGLTAAELQLVASALRPLLVGATVADVALLQDTDDVLLILHAREHKLFVHAALGARRARLSLTQRRFAKDSFASGPAASVLRKELTGATLLGIEAAAAERRCEFTFSTAGGQRRLLFELFGARGLWALLLADGTLHALSRPVQTAVRTLRRGDRYLPPPVSAAVPPEPPPRFLDDTLAAVDAHFTAIEQHGERDRLQRLLERAVQKTGARVEGLRRQVAQSDGVAALRAEADLMLAYAHAVPRGAKAMVVPDPQRDGAELRIELDPALPVPLQAETKYDRARTLEAGAATARQRLLAAETEQAALLLLLPQLAAALDDPALAGVATRLQQLGVLPRPRPTAPPERRQQAKALRADNFRRFVSAEGYPILVGRSNEQNDRLTLRTAKGNDLWLHVGGGRAGSHVIVRLPKDKTASLETLLDAGTLA